MMTDTAELRKLAEAATKDFTPNLPDDLRIPLHSLQADTAYLLGRVNIDGVTAIPAIQGSILNRLSQIETACYGLNAALTAKDAEIAALKEQRRERVLASEKRVDELLAENAALKEKVTRQAEALRPLLGYAEHYEPEHKDDMSCGIWVSLGDLRRAAQEASE